MFNVWSSSGRSTVLNAGARLFLVLALVMTAAGIFGTSMVNAATLNVSPSGTDSPTCGSGTPCKTIGQAVTNAATGDTVSVAAGTYIEQVSISKNLTLTGAGAANTIIQAPAAAGLSANGLGIEVLLDVSGGTVNASGFAVSGPVFTPNACADDFYGIYDRGGATLNLTNVTVSNIRNSNNSFLGCQQGVGIRYGSNFLHQTALGTIHTVTVTGYQKAGIVVDGTGTNVTVSNNTVTGDGPQPNIAQNGIQISRGAVASVTGNTISGNECDVTANPGGCGPNGDSDTQSGGILLYDAGAGTTISGNTISGNDAGVLRGDTSNATGSVTISGNTLTGNRYEGIYLFGGPTTVTNNTINGPTNVGIQFGQDTTTNPPTPTGPVTLQGNMFGGGVSQQEVIPAPTVASITPTSGFNSATTAVTIAGANFVSGATVTVGGQPCTNVVVTNSGSLTCTVQPKNATGAQDVSVTNPDTKTGTKTGAFTYTTRPAAMTVYVNPTFTGPFGSDPDGSGPATAIGYDAFATIQAGVNAVAVGGTVNVQGGTYIEQVSVTKNITLTGAGAATTTIKAPNGTGLTANSFGAEALFDVEGGTVAASGFTVSGPVTASNGCADQFYGVFVGGGATLNLANATASNIRNADNRLLGCQQGLGVRYGSATFNQSGNGSIDHVTVTGYQKNGITVTHNGNVTITNNTVTGDGPQTNIAQNGIEIGDNATATVTGNTVSGNECNVTATPGGCGADGNNASQSGGILVFDETSGLTLTNNTIRNNDVGILLGDDAGKLTPLTATGNTLTGNRYEGIYLLGGPTTLTNNTITGPGAIGVQLGNGTDPNFPLTTGTVTYQNNTVSGYTKIGAAVPTLSGITPNTSNGASQSVALNGASFPLGATVTIGGQSCTGVNIPNSITLTCTAPAFTTGGAKDVVITTPDGNKATLTGAYTVTIAAPVITSLSPNSGVATGGTQVTINGTGFLPGTQVKLDGQVINSTLVSDTKIVFTTSAHMAGTVTITVFAAGGQTSNGVTFTFGTVGPQPTPEPTAPVKLGSVSGTPATHATAPAATGTIAPQPGRH